MTSVLSTRWKNLFLGVPNIDLDDSLVLKSQDTKVKNCHFKNFVNRRLMLCMTSSITEFRLKCLRLPKAHMLNLWLTTLLSRNVKVLEVEEKYSVRSPLCPPSSIFRSETLVVLKLCGRNFVIKMPEFVCFPNLKVLNVQSLNMHFESDSLRFAEGYPVLEELRLDSISFQKKGESKASLKIFMRTLKKLAVISMKSYFSRIDIYTPHLQHLECSFAGNSARIPEMQVNLCAFEYLVSAHLSCLSFGDGGQWFTKFLSKVNHVKELKFTEAATQVLNSWTHSLPQFPNMTNLILSTTEKTMWNLLQRAPNLKVFSFFLGPPYSSENCLPLENEPLCFAHNLREIRMRCFRSCPREIELVRFFLEHGAMLEKIIIEYPNGKKELPSTTLKQLLNMKRRSPECKIELDDHNIIPYF